MFGPPGPRGIRRRGAEKERERETPERRGEKEAHRAEKAPPAAAQKPKHLGPQRNKLQPQALLGSPLGGFALQRSPSL